MPSLPQGEYEFLRDDVVEKERGIEARAEENAVMLFLCLGQLIYCINEGLSFKSGRGMETLIEASELFHVVSGKIKKW